MLLEQKVALQKRKAKGACSSSRARAAALTYLQREVGKLPTSALTYESSFFKYFHAFFIFNLAA